VAPLGVAASPIDRFSDIFVFGDSLSDPGNLFTALIGGPVSPVPPIYPDAQFTDGDTWASQIGADFASGRNYAHGAARAAPTGAQTFEFPDPGTSDPSDTLSITFDVPDFDQQIAQYRAASPTLGAKPLAAVWFGGNDLRDALRAPNPATAITTALGSLAAGINALIGEGFSNIAVFGLPDLGQIPEIRALGGPTMTAATGASLQFNAAIAGILGAAPRGVDVAYIDTFGLFGQTLGDPGAFGFTNTTDTCVDALLAGTVTDCSGYLFYDDIHPTEQAHALLAASFEAALAAVPLPAGLWLMLSGLGAIGLLKRRRAATA